MNTTGLRAGALACALLTTTCLTAPALAQTADSPPDPRYQIDENGVDVARGTSLINVTDVAIGPSGAGGLAYVRQLGRTASRNPYDMGIFQSSGSTWIATFGLRSYQFTLSGGTYAASDGSGATLTKSGSTYILTTEAGVTVTYDYNVVATADSSRKSRATGIAFPTGEHVTLAWVSTVYCSNNSDGCGTGTWRTAVRLQSVSSSLGYQLHLNYGLATASDLGDYGLWKRLDSISAINTTVETCSPTAHSCALTRSWPTVSYSGDNVTDPVGRTSRYTTGATTFSIRRPSSAADDIVYTYDANNRVTSVVRDGLTWSYGYSLSGSTATMVVTDPGSHARTIVSDTNVGLPTSITNEVGKTTNYAYDSGGRLTRITAPEGNSLGYSYDGRGNLTEARLREKDDTGDTGDDIVASASYPTSCANAVTCNQPTSTTDANGQVTDYTYDTTHGGVLTVTAPAPATGAVRPQVRYSYSTATAPGGGSVYRLTAVSQCRTTSSCAGGADEVKTTIAYGQANLQPSSISSGAGDGSLTATGTIGYDYIGRPITFDGPLAGSDDIDRTRYDLAGEVIGTVSPDPDGAGALHNRARRFTYDADGLPTRVETGTVDSQSDADWATFSSLEEVQQDYDASARPIIQRLVSGGTTYALIQTSYDSEGRVQCVAQRMNPAEFATASLPADACTLDTEGSYGPDRITRTTYDNADRVTLVQTGFGVTGVQADEMAAVFTDNGQVLYVTDANGNVTAYQYDGFDRPWITYYANASGGGINWSDYEAAGYDAAGNVTSRRLRNGASIGYGYDQLGRLTMKNLPGSELDVTYAYDLMGRMTSAATSAQTLSFAYDALGRMTSETGPFGTNNSTYDLAGQRTRLTGPASYDIGFTYNLAGDLTAVLSSSSASLANYAYDDGGRRIAMSLFTGPATGYGYDAVGRLTSLSHNLAGTGNDIAYGYAYNPAGEIVSRTNDNTAYSYTGYANANVSDSVNGLNQVTATGGTSVSHDTNGNISAIGSSSYSYDSENRLTGAPGGVSLAYDPLGRLFSVTSGGAVRQLAYDGGQVIDEYDGAGTRTMVYIFGGGEPIVWFDSSGPYGAYHADERGSVVALSDSAGALTGAINRYDEYGNVQGTLNGRFGYTGQAWVPEAGLYDYRNRAYNPALGRFMQTDPIGLGGGMNLYAYVGNDPVNFVDPLGLGDCHFDDLHVTDITVCGHRPPPGVGGINSHGGSSGNTLVTEVNSMLQRIFARHEEEQTIVVTGARRLFRNTLIPAMPSVSQVRCAIGRAGVVVERAGEVVTEIGEALVYVGAGGAVISLFPGAEAGLPVAGAVIARGLQTMGTGGSISIAGALMRSVGNGNFRTTIARSVNRYISRRAFGPLGPLAGRAANREAARALEPPAGRCG